MRKTKFLILTILIAIICMSFMGCSSKNYDVKKVEAQVDFSQDAYSQLEYISSTYPNRTMGAEESLDFISNEMASLSAYGYEVTEQLFTVDNTKTTKNIVASKANDTTKDKIVIGACWDNVYEAYDSHPDGAYQSGAAIAALNVIANYLKDKELKYNLELVLFSGGSANWSGAQYYMDKLTAEDKQNIKLFINLGYIVGGDNQYIYSRDKDVNYGNFISQVLDANGITSFAKVPLYKNTFPAAISENQLYRYSHIGMFGNNIIFMNNKIPSINYMSINWSDYSTPIYVEKKGKNNICQTGYDTFEVMIERNGEDTIKSQLNAVITSLVDVVYVNQDGLVDVLQDADEVNSFMQSEVAYYIFNVVVKIVLLAGIVLSVLYAKSLIAKKREEYRKIKADTPIIKVNIPTDGTNGDDFASVLKKIIEEEEKKKNEHHDNDDDNDTPISDDDVFQ